MVEAFTARVLTAPGRPTLVVNQRAYLECGCQCLVGVRIDRRPPELCTLAGHCSEEHRQLTAHFVLLFRESLVEPRPDRIVDVADELLEQAQRYYAGSPA